MNETPVSADAPADDPCLVLTPAGALHAYGERVPDETSAILQTLMPRGASLRRSAWLELAPEHRTVLARALYEGWVHEVQRELRAPDVRLDNYLPHAIAGLSGTQSAQAETGILMGWLLIPGVLLAVSFASLFFYPLFGEPWEAIKHRLAAMHVEKEKKLLADKGIRFEK